MPNIFLLLFVFLFIHSVGIETRFTCGDVQEVSKEILLYLSEDTLRENEMANKMSNKNGEIRITGSVDLPEKMKPVLVFQNRCGIDNESECYNIFTIFIPSEYVYRGGIDSIEEFYEIGTINLANSIFPENFVVSKVCP